VFAYMNVKLPQSFRNHGRSMQHTPFDVMQELVFYDRENFQVWLLGIVTSSCPSPWWATARRDIQPKHKLKEAGLKLTLCG
jgi:hypothetical protein